MPPASDDTRTRAVHSAYRSLLRASAGFLSGNDVKLIRRAINLAIEASGTGTTVTGERQVLHSLAVARIVSVEMNLGTTTVLAALLHDVTGHNPLTDELIAREFGENVATILKGIVKVNAVDTRHSGNQTENFRKLLLSLADDVRVIVIKLVERLDEMRHLEGAEEGTRLRIASETYFLYAPLAHRLGFYNLKTEMEDLAMKYLEPHEYQYIEDRLRHTSSSRNRLIREFIIPLREKLDKLGIEYLFNSRTKWVHSIWLKRKTQGVDFDEVFDIFAVRIIIESSPEREKADCWQVYSVVTDVYQPNPGRLRDWISVPKSNGYESLHTTVMGPRGKWVEVQIRSSRMDDISEKGLAAHYRYKGQRDSGGGLEVWLEKMRELLESTSKEEEGFIDQVRSGLYSDEVFVFTPKGEIRRLPAGATVLDFAFAIHTEVGARCVGARINGKNVTFRYVLNNGDQVSVLTSKNQKPGNDWLSWVITGKARTRIRQALNEDRAATAAEGKEILVRRLKNWKMSFSDTTVNKLLARYNLKNSQDLYVKISTEEIDLLDLKEFLLSTETIPARGGDAAPTLQPPGDRYEGRDESFGDYLIIENRVEGIDYKLSKCCNPVYGDNIFGFITISEGIKIHRTGCPNAEYMMSRYPYRVVPAKWKVTTRSPSFLATIKVSGVEDIGIVSRISDTLAGHSVSVRSFNYGINDNMFEGMIQLTVPNVSVLYGLIRKIRSIKGVVRAVRTDS
jgi:GTP pyrophosphokinase